MSIVRAESLDDEPAPPALSVVRTPASSLDLAVGRAALRRAAARHEAAVDDLRRRAEGLSSEVLALDPAELRLAAARTLATETEADEQRARLSALGPRPGGDADLDRAVLDAHAYAEHTERECNDWVTRCNLILLVTNVVAMVLVGIRLVAASGEPFFPLVGVLPLVAAIFLGVTVLVARNRRGGAMAALRGALARAGVETLEALDARRDEASSWDHAAAEVAAAEAAAARAAGTWQRAVGHGHDPRQVEVLVALAEGARLADLDAGAAATELAATVEALTALGGDPEAELAARAALAGPPTQAVPRVDVAGSGAPVARVALPAQPPRVTEPPAPPVVVSLVPAQPAALPAPPAPVASAATAAAPATVGGDLRERVLAAMRAALEAPSPRLLTAEAEAGPPGPSPASD